MTTDERPQRPNILFLVHRVPFPPDKGERIRNLQILKFLHQRASIHLACLADEPVADATIATLRGHSGRLAIAPLGAGRWLRALGSFATGGTITAGAFRSPSLRATLRDWARDTRYDAVFISASSMVSYYLERKELQGVPAVVDFADVDSQKWFDYASASWGPRAWLYRTEGHRLRRLEQSIAGWARAVTLVSQAEVELLQSFCPDAPVHGITNGVNLDPPLDGPADDDTCVFVGVLDYRPNVDAICWFCDEIWPAILARRPRAKVVVVGRKPAAAVLALRGRPGVEIVGQVPDVRLHLARAAVVVVPLRLARGVQNKVLEGLAMGKAVVASPTCLAGLRARPGVHLLAASTPPEWAESVVQLFADSARRRQLGDAGRRYVEENHRWERCLQPFEALLGLSRQPVLAS
jgi:sugar transferase (PEP-CTERM/EpsH1 system associated)